MRKGKNSDTPLLPEGWKTVSMLATEHGGSDVVWLRRLHKLEGTLITETAINRQILKAEAAEHVSREMIGMHRQEVGRPVFAISPQTLPRLIENLIPELPEGWKNANMLALERGGNAKTWQRRIEELQDTLGEEEAAMVGLRQGKSGVAALAVHPDLLERLTEKIAPDLPEGWKTANMLSHENGESHQVWQKRMTTLRDTLVRDIIADTRTTKADAGAQVEANLIGTRKPWHGPAALAASPDALRSLETMIPPPVPELEEGWATGSMLHHQHGGADKIWTRRMQEFADQSREELMGKGMNTEEAAAYVDEHLVGERKNSNKTALAASPTAQKILMHEKMPVRIHMREGISLEMWREREESRRMMQEERRNRSPEITPGK